MRVTVSESPEENLWRTEEHSFYHSTLNQKQPLDPLSKGIVDM